MHRIGETLLIFIFNFISLTQNHALWFWQKNNHSQLNRLRRSRDDNFVCTGIMRIRIYPDPSLMGSISIICTCLSACVYRVLLKRGTENGTENGTEWKTEWSGKYAMRYTYTCVKHRYTIFVWITPLSHWQCICTMHHKIELSFSRVKEIWNT